MAVRLSGLVFVVLIVITVFSSVQAIAAVRVCGKPVLGELSNANSRTAARRAAISSWKRNAARLGKSFTSWRLAADKRYRCARLKDGRHACVAFAKPCRYLQRIPPRSHRRGFRQEIPPKPLPPKRPGAGKPTSQDI
ncbi:MAG: hypothetical protein KDJ45_06140 [Hyphomicrobiaceae bacterium]|nr:hypothetical protein [Hyphomicrobiaceae bacterium]MCC0010335.1 hypothetical protein [Hyphomicrobiaceae bacterium]